MQNRPHSQQCPKFQNIHWLIKYHRLLRSASFLFKKLQFYLSWPIQFSTKFSWSYAPASDCVNGTRPQCFILTSGSFHAEDIVLQNLMCLRFIWLDMLHITTPSVWATPDGYFRCVCALAWVTDRTYFCAKFTDDREKSEAIKLSDAEAG